MAEIITGDDCRTFEKYLEPGTGAWTTMPEPDKAAYRKVHQRLEQIVREALAGDGLGEELDHRLTLGFNPSGGVRGDGPRTCGARSSRAAPRRSCRRSTSSSRTAARSWASRP
jgi:hypothetical protein